MESFEGSIHDGGSGWIRALDCFDALLDDEKQALWEGSRKIHFKAGENIIREGFVASNVLFLEEGMVRLDVIVDGQHSAVNIVGSQSFVGLLCTFASHNLVCSAQALEPCQVRVIDLQLFERFIRQNGQFADRKSTRLNSSHYS